MRFVVLGRGLFYCIFMVLANPALADATRDALAEIAKCADLPDSAERLKCFDTAMPRARSALATTEQPAKEKSFLEWFGFSSSKPVQKAEEFGKPAPPPTAGEVTEITATVIEFAKTARGKAVFILDNGHVWRQLDADDSIVRESQSGGPMKVTIGTGVMGSYNLTIEGRNGLIKVIRLK